MAKPDEDARDHRALATTGKQHARSITAAATRFDLTKKADRQAIPRRPDQWQTDAWAMFDLVGPVKFAGRFMGNAFSRLRFYAGIRVEPDEPPVPIRDLFTHQENLERQNAAAGPGDELVPIPFPGLTLQHVEDAEEQMGRLRNRRTGQGGLQTSWGSCLFISGDSWMIGQDEKNTDGEPTGDEEWVVVSDQGLVRTGDRIMVKQAPNTRPEVIPEDATVIRIYRPHAAWPAIPDSNMRAALDGAEDYLALARMFRSIGKSRNNAGILTLPTELDFANPTPPSGEAGAPPRDDMTKFERDLMKSLMTPVEDDASASAVVPHIIRGAAAVLEQIRHIPITRDVPEGFLRRYADVIAALARDLDMPAEVLLGMGTPNHWNVWAIQDDTYKAFVEPAASLPAWALTSAYLKPMLRADPGLWGTPVGKMLLDKMEVGVNPADLVVRPNRGQDAKDGHKAMVLSDNALRKHLGFADTDAPSDEELNRRLALERGQAGSNLTRELLIALLDAPLVPPEEAVPDVDPDRGPGPSDGPPADGDQPIPDTEPDASTVAPVTAAAPARNVGARLAAIDQRLRDRLQVAASAAVDDAVRVAGNRLRSAARSGPPEAKAVVQPGDRPALHASACGPALHAAGVLTDADEDTALEGAFVALGAQWDQWVAQAQDDTEAVLRSAAQIDDEHLDTVMAEYRTDQDQDRHAGWGILSVALLAVARGRVRGLTDDDTGEGEFDDTLSVQAGPVRQALSRAGGSVEPSRPPATVAGRMQPGAAGGVATGPQALNTLPHLGLMVQGWEWHTGAPSRPFPPHSRLEGTIFTSWDDPALAYSGWPHMGFAFPSDHAYCQCDAEPLCIPATDAALLL